MQKPQHINHLTEELINYAETHSSPEPELLANLSRETWLKVLYPRMISGHFQGRLLSFLSHIIQPKVILEVGTFTGYACLCLAEGLAPEGKIIAMELDPEREWIIRKYAQAAGIIPQLQLQFGDALQMIAELNEPLDLVFLDADKSNYLTYYEMLFPKLRKGAVILADNVLWSGKVIDAAAKDKETKGIQAFNDFVVQDERVDCILLPIRDGLMMIRKK